MAPDTQHEKLTACLVSLQSNMQDHGIWAVQPPSPDALMSDQPFCVDTLPLEHWLQFVMIPRFYWMMSEGVALPIQCDVAPMAEEAFKNRKLGQVISCLTRIDGLLTVS